MWTELFSRARNLVRAHPALYRPYLQLRGSSVEFPDAQTRLHVTGYPRSANTSTFFIFRELIDERRLTSHNHTVADLKMARRHGVDTIVMLRQPLDAISSHVVKRRHQPDTQHPVVRQFSQMGSSLYVQMALLHYVQYYRYVSTHWRDFVIGDFELAVEDPVDFVREVDRQLGFDLDWTPEAVERGRDRYRERKQAEEDEPAEISGLPDADKERQKAAVKRKLRSHAELETAKRLYDQLRPRRS